MAFGDGTTRSGTAALYKAKSIVTEAILGIKKDTGVAGILMGDVANKVAAGNVQLSNLVWKEGVKFDVTVTTNGDAPTYVANAAAALGALTPTAPTNPFVNAEFEMSRVVLNLGLDNRDLELIKGGEPTAPAGDYESNIRRRAVEDVKQFFQTEICKAQTQARNTLGGLPFIVDNATSYIADRSDATHINLRSYENAFGAAISLNNVLTIINTVQAQSGARPNLGVLPTALYTKFHLLVSPSGRYEFNSGGKDVYGGAAFEFMGIPFIMEPGLDASFSGDCYLLNTNDWRFYMSANVMSAAVIPNPARVDSSLFRMAFNAGVACVNPRRQGKGTGLS